MKTPTPTTTDPRIPAGYWQDTQGNLVPEANVRDIDKLRDQTVRLLFECAQEQAQHLRAFKERAMDDVTSFVQTSMEQYGVKIGGEKGNVTLMTFDGKYKLVRQMQDYIVFGEQLKAAKALIDACVVRWSEGANANIRVLVNDAFQVDKQGNINTGRVLGLRRLAIQDPDWQTAMQAISDSVQVATTRPYIRFYVRDDASGRYEALSRTVNECPSCFSERSPT